MTPRALRPLTCSKGRAALGLSLLFVSSGCAAFGKSARGERLARMQASANYHAGVFKNEQPMHNRPWSALGRLMFGAQESVPRAAIDVVHPEPNQLRQAPDSGVQLTWLGHSTILIQVDGKNYLTDPVWGKRTSPYSWLGPKRWYPPPLELSELPPLDAVLISHDHYDHLDYPTILALKGEHTRFVVPLGVGAHLEKWGVANENIIELDWWDEYAVDDHRLVSVPSRHASGRGLFDQNETLWCGFVIVATSHRLYFSGDTGFFSGLRTIGKRFGPFDFTMIEVGAYDRAWPDWHMGPEQAVLAHHILGGKVMLPIHWGLFALAPHGWTAPIERVLAASQELDVVVTNPRPGQTVDERSALSTQRWWQDVPFEDADGDPIVATKNGDKTQRYDFDELRRCRAKPEPIKVDRERNSKTGARQEQAQ